MFKNYKKLYRHRLLGACPVSHRASLGLGSCGAPAGTLMSVLSIQDTFV